MARYHHRKFVDYSSKVLNARRDRAFERSRSARDAEEGRHDSGGTRDPWQKRQGLIFDFDATERNRQPEAV